MTDTQREQGQSPIISIQGIRKTFGQNEVLKGINMEVSAGEVIAIIGGNGAGKSTLMKIIMGIYQPDQGELMVNGKKVNLSKPSVALAQGIYMVPQEPMLFPNMTAEENILMGFTEKVSILRKRLLDIMEEIGWKMDLSRKASSLSIAEQQLVEILRGVLRESQLLILDEPTSALTFDEVESLFHCVNGLKNKGVGIVYITHRLSEVFELASHVAILRDGTITLSGEISQFTREILVKGLLPPDMEEERSHQAVELAQIDYSKANPILELKKFSGYGFRDIDLKLYPGEILGIGGVVGAGRTELATTIFGRDKVLGGQVILDGEDITGLSTAKILEAGINYVPEDRHYHGLFKISSSAANTTSAILNRREMGRFFLNRKEEYKVTQKYVEDFRTKVTGHDQLTGSLSGGNQQKIVIARSLSTNPKVVILDEPTRGIDAAARGDVYAIIRQLQAKGLSIILISSDMEEIVELSNRAVAVFQGRIFGEFFGEDVNQDNLMAAAFGVAN